MHTLSPKQAAMHAKQALVVAPKHCKRIVAVEVELVLWSKPVWGWALCHHHPLLQQSKV